MTFITYVYAANVHIENIPVIQAVTNQALENGKSYRVG